MQDKLMLMIPGPTPVPERVLLAMAQHPMGHRSGDFSKIIGELNENLKWLHQTKNEVITLCSSGTGAMEAGIINFLSAGDKVLVGNNGKFGERWAILSRAFGLDVEEVTAPWGQQLDPEDFRAKLESDTEKKIKAVIITHSETSTGVLNDLETINKHVKAHGEALIIVDAVTSLGAVNVPMDEWGLDVVASGSQKGYMIPPGMGFVAVSDKAWEAYKTATLPKFYLDLAPYKKANAKNSSPFTPPINLMFALKAALEMMKEEGLQNIFDRHKRLTHITREGVKALGLPLYANDEAAALAITAVIPDKHDAEAIRSTMRKKYDIALAGGQDHLSGKIFRMGHLGFVSERDVLTALAALKETLSQVS
ncbi:alanine--glyoxylate aminotransferase family protein [Geminocystis sp.]|uniref:pyridoxal-phosphate-dependent aminotransferase family protein n=1 Tax=Geminocystis sp. TaxID=2664100 RepID=UPI003593E998